MFGRRGKKKRKDWCLLGRRGTGTVFVAEETRKKRAHALDVSPKSKGNSECQDKSRPSPPFPIPCQTYLHPFLVSSLHRISILKISSPGRETTAKPREDRAGDTYTPCYFLPMKNEESARSCGVSPLCACADYWDKERAERFCCSLHAKM